MAIKTVSMISVLVLFSLGTLAQKPQNMLRDNPQVSQWLHSSYNPETRLQAKEEKVYPFRRVKDDERQKPKPSCTINRLKAEPATPSLVEKLDSLVDYYYNQDSMMWYPEDAEYYQYDAQGRNYSLWDGNYDPQMQVMVPDDKTELRYTADGQVSEKIYYSWVDSTRYWQPDYRYSYTFDADGNEITQTSYNWNEFSKMWFSDYVDTTSYTGSGNIWKRYEYWYNSELMSWEPQYRYEYNYDGSDFLVQQSMFHWVFDTVGRWENDYQTNYYNDDQGRDTSSVDYHWDGFSWNEQYMETTRYDANGNMALEENFNWDAEMMEWYGSWKSEYTYDGNNRQTQSVSYSWDYNKLNWFINNKDEYVWDANGNILEEIGYDYDTASQTFNLNWKDLYGYDLSLEIKNIAMPYWWEADSYDDEQMWVNKIVSYTELYWDTVTMSFDTSYIESLYYSGLYDTPVNDILCRADFDWSLDEKDDKLVHFTDLSDTTIVSWYWIFGDGETSTRQNPMHMYANPGTYKVALSTVDESGLCNNTTVKQIKVGNPACNAAFSYMVDTIKQEVTLVNKSGGTNLEYFWSFGDGSVAKVKDPVHQYQYPGAYEITLTVTNDAGSCMDRYTATVRAGSITCNADFVVFVDSSTNNVYFRAKQINPKNTYRWIFGDGSVASTPNHFQAFSHPGHYSAVLTVSNKQAGCVESRRVNLLVGRKSPGGKAGFIYVAGIRNQVAFTNQSLGTELSYLWNFNDGETSTDNDPVHSYVLPGYYNVCLTVTTKDGRQDTYCEKIFAGAGTTDQCLARFQYTLSNDGLKIACVDRSFGNPDQWKWTYNDEWSSDVQNPDWSTGTPDYVKVQQTIRNSTNGCRDDAFALVNMGAKSKLKAGFGYVIDSSNTKASSYPVDFIGVSLGDAGKLKWTFGDGTSDSTTINPVHIYSEPGTYEVCLTITNSATGEQDVDCQIITVDAASFQEELTSANTALKTYPNPFSHNTRIEIRLSENSEIDLSLYDLTGRKVKTIARDQRKAGTYIINLNGSDLERGNYYLVLETGTGRARQMISIIR